MTEERGTDLRGNARRNILWGVLIVVLAGVSALGMWPFIRQQPLAPRMLARSAPRLPVYGALPDFALVERSGRSVRRSDLEGKIWVASFIFTHCADECPQMAAELARLQADVAALEDIRLVSITVDPERDTPAVLSQYAERFTADPERWLFLTGDKEAIYRLARDGFRLGIVDATEAAQSPPVKEQAFETSGHALAHEPYPSQTQIPRWLPSIAPSPAFADHGRTPDILHAARFVLVDRRAQIRGYYDSREAADLHRLRQHLQTLRRET
jgi:cytochrome oxidase Cu insertion factor (SCO1/SenC/PrrC family)